MCDRLPRRSVVLDKLRSGKKAISFKNNFACARATEQAALAGFDCIWICCEHVPTDFDTMEKQILAAKAHNTDIIVRVAKGSYSDFIRPLEADATGIMIPHLMSADEAREIVWKTRFHPLGRRPVDGGNADGQFCRLPCRDYIQFMNENRMIIVQIEAPEPLAELEEICQVPGIDMIFFGPGDFSHALGIPGELNHPEVNRARRQIAETAHKYGKFAGTTCSMENMKAYFELGYDFLNCGSDVSAMNDYCNRVIKLFRS